MRSPAGEIISPSRRRGFDWFDGLVLAATAGLSACVLMPLLLTGHTITGGDGLFPVDQLQYLSWIRQASQHGLIGNRFDMVPDTRVFLHPGFLLSGLAHRWLGVPINGVNAAIWKPVSILVVFFGTRQYVRRLITGVWPERVALVLAIFVLLPMSSVFKALGAGYKLRYNLDFITSEMWPGQQLVGYEVAATAVFAVPIVLLGVERARRGGRPLLLAACALGAMLIMWLQPWQGAELLFIVAGVELWRWWRHAIRPHWPLAVMAITGAAPAVYYAALERTDPAWELYGKTNRSFADPLWDWSWLSVALCLAPFLIAAAPALRRGQGDWQQTAVRVWPVAVLVVYMQPTGTFPFHSIQGLSIPLVVLAVQGLTVWRPSWIPRPRWWWVLPVVLVATVPGTAHRLSLAKDNIDNKVFPYTLKPGEQAALKWIEASSVPGGVLADAYGGLLVPAYAGRDSFIGPRVLTPNFSERSKAMNHLMFSAFFAARSGVAPSPDAIRQAREFVSQSGGRFIFEECGGWKTGAPDLMPLIGPLVQAQRRFGCARVYVLKQTTESRRLSPLLGGTDGP